MEVYVVDDLSTKICVLSKNKRSKCESILYNNKNK